MVVVNDTHLVKISGRSQTLPDALSESDNPTRAFGLFWRSYAEPSLTHKALAG
jgi:hypothetical protein